MQRAQRRRDLQVARSLEQTNLKLRALIVCADPAGFLRIVCGVFRRARATTLGPSRPAQWMKGREEDLREWKRRKGMRRKRRRMRFF